MIHRLLPLPKGSFFLFGPRGVGKSTWLESELVAKAKGRVLSIDLLDPAQERLYHRNPERLIEIVEGMRKLPDWIVIDEVQKVPKLLEAVHLLIEKRRAKFALTGSSARKLRRGGANLLAGRAHLRNLFPFSSLELGERFDLAEALNWGCMPKVWDGRPSERESFLQAYSQTYLREEILQELVLRRVDPFRAFLEIAAQMDGKFINATKIAQDCGVDPKTIQSYFEILEDTLVGFRLPSYHASVRKRQRKAPKFYFFDVGVRRQFENMLDVKVKLGTSEGGRAFESFVIQQMRALNSYSAKNFDLMTWSDERNNEIDVILKKGTRLVAVEIKASENVEDREVAHFAKLVESLGTTSLAIILCREKQSRKVGSVLICPWEKGLRELFGY